MFSVLEIIAALVSWIGGLVSLSGRRAQQKQGAVAQAQKEIIQTAEIEAVIASAEADAPRDLNDVIEREKIGTF